MEAKVLDYARMVSLMASQGILRHADATEFCSTVLPAMLTELEILEGVSNRLTQMIASAIAPQVAEEPAEQPPVKPQPKRRGRRKKEVAND